jgi:hypothetical protein
MHVGGIFCEVAKAFECKNHEILLAKLYFCGIWSMSEDFFRSYLTNKWRKVEVKSPNSTIFFFSAWGTLKHGVPQGSIVGPLLFIIYVNDLQLRINSTSRPVLFADDTTVVISSRKFEDFCSVLNLVLSKIICSVVWCY